MSRYTSLGMFSGAGGLDLGFEQAGFDHLGAMDHDPWCVRTLTKNRPSWNVDEADAREWSWDGETDVLLAGPPCQGYSLGGNRQATDERNLLYREVIRVARATRPRVVVVENVLNLRTLIHPETGKPFDEQIATDLGTISADGYEVFFGVFRMDGYGVPQTRRRIVFVAFRDGAPPGYSLPSPLGCESVRPWLYDIGQGEKVDLPNHRPEWGFRSSVHVATGAPFNPSEEAVIVRFSRTASDGSPVRTFDRPFPAIDTGTAWGWAQGNVTAERMEKSRAEGAKFVRNPNANVKLWRISASRLRAMTHREMARLQTFPDDWTFEGNANRDVQIQIGNAVPVRFAERLARNVEQALDCLRDGVAFHDESSRSLQLFSA